MMRKTFWSIFFVAIAGSISAQTISTVQPAPCNDTNTWGKVTSAGADSTECGIPCVSWNTTSTLSIRGYTTFASAPAGGRWSQSFGNVTWNCTAQTSTRSHNGLLISARHDFLIPFTKPDVIQLSAVLHPTIQAGRDFILTPFTLAEGGSEPIPSNTNFKGPTLAVTAGHILRVQREPVTLVGTPSSLTVSGTMQGFRLTCNGSGAQVTGNAAA